MARRMTVGMSYLAVLALCASLVILIDAYWNRKDVSPEDCAKSAGVLPQHAEGLAVLKWISKNQPDAANLQFLAWLPSMKVDNNQFSGGAATALHVLVKHRCGPNDAAKLLRYYLQDGKVLGYVRVPDDPHADAVARRWASPSPFWADAVTEQ